MAHQTALLIGGHKKRNPKPARERFPLERSYRFRELVRVIRVPAKYLDPADIPFTDPSHDDGRRFRALPAEHEGLRKRFLAGHGVEQPPREYIRRRIIRKPGLRGRGAEKEQGKKRERKGDRTPA
jgi:hypothetical protein